MAILNDIYDDLYAKIDVPVPVKVLKIKDKKLIYGR